MGSRSRLERYRPDPCLRRYNISATKPCCLLLTRTTFGQFDLELRSRSPVSTQIMRHERNGPGDGVCAAMQGQQGAPGAELAEANAHHRSFDANVHEGKTTLTGTAVGGPTGLPEMAGRGHDFQLLTAGFSGWGWLTLFGLPDRVTGQFLTLDRGDNRTVWSTVAATY